MFSAIAIRVAISASWLGGLTIFFIVLYQYCGLLIEMNIPTNSAEAVGEAGGG
jgi:hypothetical protein